MYEINMALIALVFVGDSDIARWPPNLRPSIFDVNQHEYHYAYCGALLKDLGKQVKKSISEISESLISYNKIIFIACAGENDLSYHEVDDVVLSFRKFVDSIFGSCVITGAKHVIYFGPKLEPWIKDDDVSSRRNYFQLSERLKQLCNEEDRNVHFINCLTMFCSGDTKHKSVVGGTAKADALYFDDDGLHLSAEGYNRWKEEIEFVITNSI